MPEAGLVHQVDVHGPGTHLIVIGIMVSAEGLGPHD
jgi:hypothetical protein